MMINLEKVNAFVSKVGDIVLGIFLLTFFFGGLAIAIHFIDTHYASSTFERICLWAFFAYAIFTVYVIAKTGKRVFQEKDDADFQGQR